MADLCSTCNARFSKAKGECGSCYEYRRRHGHQRPPDLTQRQPELNRTRLDRQIERHLLTHAKNSPR